jgi:hypothetical protein
MVVSVLALRLFTRASPFLVAAAVGAIWWRRREQVERPALPAPVETPEGAPAAPPAAHTGRFEREPVDIVTVVDDLLDASTR